MSKRQSTHVCPQVVDAGLKYGGHKVPNINPRVLSGSFGISVQDVPLDCLRPKPDAMTRYIPLATHCPYCGKNIEWKPPSEPS